MKTDAKLTENPAENGNKSKPLLPVVFFSLYLPYSPRVKTNNIIRTLVPELPFDVNEINNYVAMNTVCTGIGHKLILRQLSDLTNDTFDFIYNTECDYQSIEKWIGLDCESRLSSKFSYIFWNLLYQYHFDIHGLIEKGLAISIDDVE
jgi:hypothetical protein